MAFFKGGNRNRIFQEFCYSEEEQLADKCVRYQKGELHQAIKDEDLQRIYRKPNPLNAHINDWNQQKSLFSYLQYDENLLNFQIGDYAAEQYSSHPQQNNVIIRF